MVGNFYCSHKFFKDNYDANFVLTDFNAFYIDENTVRIVINDNDYNVNQLYFKSVGNSTNYWLVAKVAKRLTAGVELILKRDIFYSLISPVFDTMIKNRTPFSLSHLWLDFQKKDYGKLVRYLKNVSFEKALHYSKIKYGEEIVDELQFDLAELKLENPGTLTEVRTKNLNTYYVFMDENRPFYRLIPVDTQLNVKNPQSTNLVYGQTQVTNNQFALNQLAEIEKKNFIGHFAGPNLAHFAQNSQNTYWRFELDTEIYNNQTTRGKYFSLLLPLNGAKSVPRNTVVLPDVNLGPDGFDIADLVTHHIVGTTMIPYYQLENYSSNSNYYLNFNGGFSVIRVDDSTIDNKVIAYYGNELPSNTDSFKTFLYQNAQSIRASWNAAITTATVGIVVDSLKILANIAIAVGSGGSSLAGDIVKVGGIGQIFKGVAGIANKATTLTNKLNAIKASISDKQKQLGIEVVSMDTSLFYYWLLYNYDYIKRLKFANGFYTIDNKEGFYYNWYVRADLNEETVDEIGRAIYNNGLEVNESFDLSAGFNQRGAFYMKYNIEHLDLLIKHHFNHLIPEDAYMVSEFLKDGFIYNYDHLTYDPNNLIYHMVHV